MHTRAQATHEIGWGEIMKLKREEERSNVAEDAD